MLAYRDMEPKIIAGEGIQITRREDGTIEVALAPPTLSPMLGMVMMASSSFHIPAGHALNNSFNNLRPTPSSGSNVGRVVSQNTEQAKTQKKYMELFL